MVDFQQEFVTDSNIWIDFYFGELIEEVFKLPFQFIAPDVIVEELEQPSGKSLLSLGLEKRELTAELVSQVEKLTHMYPRPSINDLFALVLAKHLKIVLLTGDGELRKAARQEGVGVHGVLWLLDKVVQYQVIVPNKAAEALRKMLAHGSRLPQSEIQKRLRLWRKT